MEGMLAAAARAGDGRVDRLQRRVVDIAGYGVCEWGWGGPQKEKVTHR